MKVLSLRSRILLAFIASSALVGLLFGLSTIIFAYHTEDQVFETLLQAEAAYAEQQLASVSAIQPRLQFVSYYADVSVLPQQIQATLQHAPLRNEFALDSGQHYHLIRLSQGFLLADVTEQLVVRQMRPQLSLFLLTLLAVVVLCSAGFAYLLARRVLKPLHKLTQLVDSTGLNPDMPLTGSFADDFAPDEIGRLARALQKARQRVAEFIGREQQFTQDVSHELRTPVTISQGALTLLCHTPLTAQQAQYVARLQHAQQQTAQSIAVLMLLAREQLPASQRVALLSLVEQSILQQQHKLEAKPVQLQLNISEDDAVVINDTVLLMLLNNLLANAFDYTAAGVISISFTRNILTIQDSGSGIDAAIRDQAFEAGVKGERSQGMGVGLSLVKRLCDKAQIRYQLESSAAGTCVRLQFPQ